MLYLVMVKLIKVMRILKLDKREQTIRLVIQTLEDLWHLHKILEPGDFVRGKTYRKVAVKRGNEVIEGDKKAVNPTIRLEKSEFHQYTGKLRLSGTIYAGPDDIQLASHHTITVDPGMQLTIQKQALKSYHIERLEKSQVKETNILFVSLDRDRVDFGLLREFGLEMQGGFDHKKTEEDNRQPFYEKIQKTLEGRKDYGKIVICGPGFERENLFSFLRKVNHDLTTHVLLEHASVAGQPGIQEVLKISGNKILNDTRISRETSFVERLLLKIRKRGLVVYGKEQVKKSIEYGALDTLLISEIKVRDFEDLIDQAEVISAKVVVIGSDHPSGEQLLALGGVAGFLRFRLQ